jgi:hypothetical protein
MAEHTPGYSLPDADIQLLRRIAAGEHTFRRSDLGSDLDSVIARLLTLRARGLVRLLDGRLMHSEAGHYLAAGPCDLTLAGRQALAEDDRLGPRSTRPEPDPAAIAYTMAECGPTRFLRVSMTGDVRVEPLAHHLLEIAAEQLFAHPRLVDVRGGRLALSRDDVRWLVQLVGGLRRVHGVSRVGVVASDDVSVGVAQMYATLNQQADPGFAVFRDAAEAEAWVCGEGGDRAA